MLTLEARVSTVDVSMSALSTLSAHSVLHDLSNADSSGVETVIHSRIFWIENPMKYR